MRPRDQERAQVLVARLAAFDAQRVALLGIREDEERTAFVEQLVESCRRIEFVRAIRERPIDRRRADPASSMFDPVRAAILLHRDGRIDEAFWLIFLFVHFGKHRQGHWRLIREVYGRLNQGGKWDWATTNADIEGFRGWLDANQGELRRPGAGFGNHRKYESLDGMGVAGTGAVAESYINWIAPPRSHSESFGEVLERSGADRRRAFDYLYKSMEAVHRFGRLARFDYLTMIGKIGLAEIEPGSTYLPGATGPMKGAELLFGRKEKAIVLDNWLIELDTFVEVGMQALEDSLCNWQKSPKTFKRFRG